LLRFSPAFVVGLLGPKFCLGTHCTLATGEKGVDARRRAMCKRAKGRGSKSRAARMRAAA